MDLESVYLVTFFDSYYRLINSIACDSRDTVTINGETVNNQTWMRENLHKPIHHTAYYALMTVLVRYQTEITLPMFMYIMQTMTHIVYSSLLKFFIKSYNFEETFVFLNHLAVGILVDGYTLLSTLLGRKYYDKLKITNEKDFFTSLENKAENLYNEKLSTYDRLKGKDSVAIMKSIQSKCRYLANYKLTAENSMILIENVELQIKPSPSASIFGKMRSGLTEIKSMIVPQVKSSGKAYGGTGTIAQVIASTNGVYVPFSMIAQYLTAAGTIVYEGKEYMLDTGIEIIKGAGGILLQLTEIASEGDTSEFITDTVAASDPTGLVAGALISVATAYLAYEFGSVVLKKITSSLTSTEPIKIASAPETTIKEPEIEIEAESQINLEPLTADKKLEEMERYERLSKPLNVQVRDMNSDQKTTIPYNIRARMGFSTELPTTSDFQELATVHELIGEETDVIPKDEIKVFVDGKQTGTMAANEVFASVNSKYVLVMNDYGQLVDTISGPRRVQTGNKALMPSDANNTNTDGTFLLAALLLAFMGNLLVRKKNEKNPRMFMDEISTQAQQGPPQSKIGLSERKSDELHVYLPQVSSVNQKMFGGQKRRTKKYKRKTNKRNNNRKSSKLRRQSRKK